MFCSVPGVCRIIAKLKTVGWVRAFISWPNNQLTTPLPCSNRVIQWSFWLELGHRLAAKEWPPNLQRAFLHPPILRSCPYAPPAECPWPWGPQQRIARPSAPLAELGTESRKVFEGRCSAPKNGKLRGRCSSATGSWERTGQHLLFKEHGVNLLCPGLPPRDWGLIARV